MDDVDVTSMKDIDGDMDIVDEEGDLLDLYVCCQCSVYCMSSGVIPGVIPRKYLEPFIKDKRDHPKPGKSGEVTVLKSLELFAKCVSYKLLSLTVS